MHCLVSHILKRKHPKKSPWSYKYPRGAPGSWEFQKSRTTQNDIISARAHAQVKEDNERDRDRDRDRNRGRDNLQLSLTTLHRNTRGLCTLAQGSPISQALTSLYRAVPLYWFSRGLNVECMCGCMWVYVGVCGCMWVVTIMLKRTGTKQRFDDRTTKLSSDIII